MAAVNEISYLKGVRSRKQPVLAPTNGELEITVVSLGEGLVQYQVSNPDPVPHAFVIYRGFYSTGYNFYFGNAYYSVYLSKVNGVQTATWFDGQVENEPIPPQPDSGYQLGVLNTGDGKNLVCFVFVVPAQSTLKVNESGISSASDIYNLHAYIVSAQQDVFCVYYNSGAAQLFQIQTGATITDMPSNPFFANTALLTPIAQGYPTNELWYGQYALQGSCGVSYTWNVQGLPAGTKWYVLLGSGIAAGVAEAPEPITSSQIPLNSVWYAGSDDFSYQCTSGCSGVILGEGSSNVVFSKKVM